MHLKLHIFLPFWPYIKAQIFISTAFSVVHFKLLYHFILIISISQNYLKRFLYIFFEVETNFCWEYLLELCYKQWIQTVWFFPPFYISLGFFHGLTLDLFDNVLHEDIYTHAGHQNCFLFFLYILHFPASHPGRYGRRLREEVNCPLPSLFYFWSMGFFFLRLQLINTMTLQVKRDQTTRKGSHLHHILEESHQFIINIRFKFYMKNK